MRRPGLLALLITCGASWAGAGAARLPNDAPTVAFESRPGRLLITIGGRPLATYVYDDRQIGRPYFAQVCGPGGIQLTRNHPPREDDSQDHATMHPGIWLSFGDLSGNDYWRGKARTVHEKFAGPPRGGTGRGSFAVVNRYLGAGGAGTVCRETCRYTILVRPYGYLLIWDSRFHAAAGEFYFGDQEEMGLGVRVATPMAVRAGQGGRIVDSRGRVNEPQIWGKQADWCQYEGTLEGRQAGVMLLADPKNFRRPWIHARDYGLIVCNPFGRNAFTGGEKSKVIVRRADRLRLRFGVLLYGPAPSGSHDPRAAYADFLRQIDE